MKKIFIYSIDNTNLQILSNLFSEIGYNVESDYKLTESRDYSIYDLIVISKSAEGTYNIIMNKIIYANIPVILAYNDDVMYNLSLISENYNTYTYNDNKISAVNDYDNIFKNNDIQLNSDMIVGNAVIYHYPIPKTVKFPDNATAICPNSCIIFPKGIKNLKNEINNYTICSMSPLIGLNLGYIKDTFKVFLKRLVDSMMNKDINSYFYSENDYKLDFRKKDQFINGLRAINEQLISCNLKPVNFLIESAVSDIENTYTKNEMINANSSNIITKLQYYMFNNSNIILELQFHKFNISANAVTFSENNYTRFFIITRFKVINYGNEYYSNWAARLYAGMNDPENFILPNKEDSYSKILSSNNHLYVYVPYYNYLTQTIGSNLYLEQMFNFLIVKDKDDLHIYTGSENRYNYNTYITLGKNKTVTNSEYSMKWPFNLNAIDTSSNIQLIPTVTFNNSIIKQNKYLYITKIRSTDDNTKFEILINNKKKTFLNMRKSMWYPYNISDYSYAILIKEEEV